MTLVSFHHCITVTKISQLYVFLPIISLHFYYTSLHFLGEKLLVSHIFIIPQTADIPTCLSRVSVIDVHSSKTFSGWQLFPAPDKLRIASTAKNARLEGRKHLVRESVGDFFLSRNYLGDCLYRCKDGECCSPKILVKFT